MIFTVGSAERALFLKNKKSTAAVAIALTNKNNNKKYFSHILVFLIPTRYDLHCSFVSCVNLPYQSQYDYA